PPPPPRLQSSNPWKILQEKYDKKEMIEVQITSVNDGGILVKVFNLSGFIPKSHLVLPQHTYGGLVGQSLEVLILEIEKATRQLKFSERLLRVSYLQVGQLVEGKIITIENRRVIIEFNNGLKGCLHISEISKNYVEFIDNMFQINQTLKAFIIRVNTSGTRIDLSTKALEKYPGEMLTNMSEVMNRSQIF
ncbi:S1 RNA-binding domain-containing protein, partial [Oscillatoria sp. HE19RPO]|uniref:S1 RNA-binding domain-containing protein n=1 Tax=Oscillatoria sp. HE19RPO TaxID=2954806 RepID=UPI0020C50C0A